MADAPERLWIEDEQAEGGTCYVHTEGTEGARKYGTEYIRADVARAAAKQREAGLVGAVKQRDDLINELCTSVDCAAEDIGGQRGALFIIRDLAALAEHEAAPADALAVAEAIRRAAEAGQEIANAARANAMTEKPGSKARNDMMERCWGAEDAVRAILALAPADALAEVQRLREEPAMTDLPHEIQVWRSMDALDHTGTWSTKRYPPEAVTYVPKADTQAAVAVALARVEKLREAPEFYADRNCEGYDVAVTNYGLSTEEGPIIRDGGDIARAALATVTPPADTTEGRT